LALDPPGDPQVNALLARTDVHEFPFRTRWNELLALVVPLGSDRAQVHANNQGKECRSYDSEANLRYLSHPAGSKKHCCGIQRDWWKYRKKDHPQLAFNSFVEPPQISLKYSDEAGRDTY
jgi:hypothetical protein